MVYEKRPDIEEQPILVTNFTPNQRETPKSQLDIDAAKTKNGNPIKLQNDFPNLHSWAEINIIILMGIKLF